LDSEPFLAKLAPLEFSDGEPQIPPQAESPFHRRKALPVIEMAILAVVAMYGMHLITTMVLYDWMVKRNPDGSYEKTEKREPFAPVIAAMVRLLSKQE